MLCALRRQLLTKSKVKQNNAILNALSNFSGVYLPCGQVKLCTKVSHNASVLNHLLQKISKKYEWSDFCSLQLPNEYPHLSYDNETLGIFNFLHEVEQSQLKNGVKLEHGFQVVVVHFVIGNTLVGKSKLKSNEIHFSSI